MWLIRHWLLRHAVGVDDVYWESRCELQSWSTVGKYGELFEMEGADIYYKRCSFCQKISTRTIRLLLGTFSRKFLFLGDMFESRYHLLETYRGCFHWICLEYWLTTDNPWTLSWRGFRMCVVPGVSWSVCWVVFISSLIFRCELVYVLADLVHSFDAFISKGKHPVILGER